MSQSHIDSSLQDRTDASLSSRAPTGCEKIQVSAQYPKNRSTRRKARLSTDIISDLSRVASYCERRRVTYSTSRGVARSECDDDTQTCSPRYSTVTTLASSVRVTPRSSFLGKNEEKSPLVSPLGLEHIHLTPEIYAVQFPEALPLEEHVYAWHSARRVWHSATIIHARDRVVPKTREDERRQELVLAPQGLKTERCHPSLVFLGNEALSSPGPPPSVTPETAGIDPEPYTWSESQASYDYYIHFHGEDRRHDTWMSIQLIRPKAFPFGPGAAVVHVDPGPDEIHKHMDMEYLKEHEENTKLKTIGTVFIGDYLLGAWYFSPYPKEYQNVAVLYLCEFCLAFFKHEPELRRHAVFCTSTHPPGNEIYRDPETKLAVFEVDGAVAKTYSENLCYLSKLFLDHKTLRHPVFLFLFYILTEKFEGGHRLVGYFSKEKYSKNNLSCIMCLPQHQRKGYGQFLINMSYALSCRQGRRGTPERPLSDLGRATYIKYWGQVAVSVLLSTTEDVISLEEIAAATSVEVVDLIMALETIGILQYTQPGNVPFFFLPEEYDQVTWRFARPVFINRMISEPSSACIKQLLDHETRDPRPSKHSRATYALPSSDAPAAAESEATRRFRRSACTTTTTGLPLPKLCETRGKRRRYLQSSPSPVLELDPQKSPPDANATIASKSVTKPLSTSSVNLAWLRWEPYDAHMGPYEFAPTAG